MGDSLGLCVAAGDTLARVEEYFLFHIVVFLGNLTLKKEQCSYYQWMMCGWIIVQKETQVNIVVLSR